MKIIRPVTVAQTGSFTRASTGKYYDFAGVYKTAAINEPRFNFDPTNLAAGPTLLMESAATNLLLNSEGTSAQLDTQSGVGTAGVSITGFSNSISVGDNTVTRYAYKSFNTVIGTVYAFSVFIQMDDNGVPLVSTNNNPGNGGDLMLAIQADVATMPSTITYVGNNVYRCSIVFTATTVGVHYGVVKYDTHSARGFRVTGYQLEVDKVTSYITSAGAATTRAADVNTAALLSNVPETDYAAWSAVSQYIRGDRVMDISVHKVYEALTGERGVATLTVASPAVVTMKDRDGNPYVPTAGTPIKFTTTGALPTGLVVGTTYYVTAPGVASFNVSATVGGANIATSGTQSGVHTATASLNLNMPVTNKTHWADAGSNNRWSMFDQSITSQTSQADTVIVAFTATERFDSIVGLNLGASSVTINVSDPVNGITFSTSEVLTSDSGITDMFSYLYEPIVQIGEFLADIPVAISTSSTVTVCFKGAVAAIGGLVFGMSREIGITEWGVRIGTVDYGVKSKDAFGNYTVQQRAFSKRADFTIQVPTGQVDYLQTLLTQYRSVPVVYIGSNTGKTQFKSTIIYGFYKDFSIDIAYDAYSVCSMQIEGLT